jgi:hypothetical protein
MRTWNLFLLTVAVVGLSGVYPLAQTSIGDRTCSQWTASLQNETADAQSMRTWLLGYYHGVLASKPANTLWVRPMEIVPVPGSSDMEFTLRTWNEQALAKLMSQSCAADPDQRLRDAAAAVMAELVRTVP